MSNVVEASFKIDLDKVTNVIDTSETLSNDSTVFAQLADIQRAKQTLKAAQDEFEVVEKKAKQAISDRARALYGVNWSAIKGEGYKITRSGTGSVYGLQDAPTNDPSSTNMLSWLSENLDLLPYVKIAVSVNADAVGDHVVAKGGLPDGVEYNPQRGEQIRITVDKGLL